MQHHATNYLNYLAMEMQIESTKGLDLTNGRENCFKWICIYIYNYIDMEPTVGLKQQR